MKTEDNNTIKKSTSNVNDFETSEDRQVIINELLKQTEEKAREEFSAKQLVFEKERIALLGGGSTSVFEQKEALKRFVSDEAMEYGSKFSEFFKVFGELMKWSEGETNAFRKPAIVARTINEIIYARFPNGVMEHIYINNPYIKYCVRKTFNYKFLNEDGIFKLEIFIDDAVTLMKESVDLYDFRVKHAAKFGTFVQLKLI
jgi:hypothetical protein